MLILASKSPRRREILLQMGFSFRIADSEYEENNALAVPPDQLVRLQAEGKAAAVYKRMGDNAVVIGADTLVVLDGKVLGKPRNEAQAMAMLKALSGRTHEVMTGVAVWANEHCWSDVCVSRVTFRPLADEEIRRYVATGEPMDKAGAYGVQGLGRSMVDKVEGSLSNVIGLPRTLIKELIQKATGKR